MFYESENFKISIDDRNIEPSGLSNEKILKIILQNRNISDDEVSNFLQNYNINSIDPFEFPDMEKSIEIILAISKFLDVSITHDQAVKISKKFSRTNVIKIIENKNKELNEKISKKSKIDEKDIVFVSEKLSINKEMRAFDTSTGFQTGHISQSRSTNWEIEFSTNEKKILNDTFKDWLLKFKY